MFKGFFCCLCLVLVGCSSNQVSRVSVVQAPEVQKASGLKSIAVARIAGAYGDDVTVAVESVFVNARIQGNAVYRNVIRVNPTRSLKGDIRGAATLIKSRGVEAILLGEVASANVSDSRNITTEYVCTQSKKIGKFLSKCISGYNKKIYCTNRKAVMQVNFQLIDGLGGNSIYNEMISHSNEASACGDEQITDGRELMKALVGKVVDTLQTRLIPHDRLINISLMSADNKIEKEEEFNNALKFAAQNRIDRACEMFRELYENSKESPALNYNLGVCEESANAYWRASEYFQLADRLTSSPNHLINLALERTKNNIRSLSILANNRKDINLKKQIEDGVTSQIKKKAIIPANVSSINPVPVPIPQIDSEALMMDRRVALVIGNAKYRQGALLNPVNDARAITKELRGANFRVISVEDVDLQKMNLAIDEFVKFIKKDGVALVFYAGHGMQVKGENYLIPVDAMFKEESEVPYRAINLGYILGKLENAKSRVNIVILDACRDNPFARSWRSGKSGGLASIDAPAGTLIAFATAPGKTAADGTGTNGLYTSYLLKQLRIKNQKIEDILKNTRKAVAAASGQEQVPWDSSSMIGDFYFQVGASVSN